MMRPRLSSDKLTHLINSALFVDSVMGHGFRNVADLTPEERERGERWRRWRDGGPTARRPEAALCTASAFLSLNLLA
jgi:hypothetical protein